MTYCECGCGDRAKGGTFLPGHDQRLRSAIEKAAGGILKLRDIVKKETGQKIICEAKDQ